MARQSILKPILLGITSGIISGLCCLVLAYFAGVIVVAISLRELLPTLLTAATVLPLMLIIIGIPVTFVLAVVTGGLLGIGAALRSKAFGFLAGALVGAICAELLLSLLVPLVLPPQQGDFVHIVSSPYLSGSYGAVLGVVTSLLFRWLDGKKEVMSDE